MGTGRYACSRGYLTTRVEDIDGLLCLLTDSINHSVPERAKNLKAVSLLATISTSILLRSWISSRA